MGKKYFNQIINKGNVKKAVSLQLINFIMLIILIFFIGNVNKGSGKTFFHFGPTSNNITVEIFGLDVDSWKKWLLVIVFLLVFEGINTFSYKIFKNWYRNYVQDPKSATLKMDKKEAFWNIFIFRAITQVSQYFKWAILIITKQFQFILPQYLIRLIISMYIDNTYLEK